MNISFQSSFEENELILNIAKRAKSQDKKVDLISLAMDLTATHLNGNPLKLKELFEADDFNFNHDIYGIMNNLCRDSGKLRNCFLPRFSA